MPLNPLHSEIPLLTVHLVRQSPRDKLGMIVSYRPGEGILIDTVLEEGYVAKSGEIGVGDEIIQVNGLRVLNQEEEAIHTLLREVRLDLLLRKEMGRVYLT